MAKLTFSGPKHVITPPCRLRHFHLAHELGVAPPARRRQNLSRSKLRTAVVGGALIALGFAASGCASHRFVRDQVEVVDTRVTGVEGTAGQALQRANDAHKLAEGKFLYQVVLSDDSVKFPTDASALSPEAEQRLAQFAHLLRSGRAGRLQRHPRGPVAEPPRDHRGPRLSAFSPQGLNGGRIAAAAVFASTGRRRRRAGLASRGHRRLRRTGAPLASAPG